MKNLTTTLCLTIAVLLGSMGVSWSEKKLSIEIPDPIPAVECYKPRAEQGDANALFEMG